MTTIIPGIEPWAEQLAASLWRASWQGGIALALAWAIARWCTFLSPRVVCWVWRLACLKVLLALVWIEPVSRALLPARQADTVTFGSAAVRAPGPEATVDVPAVRTVAPVASQPVQIPPALGVWSLLTSAWLLGVVYCVVASAREWGSIRRLVQSAVDVPSERLHGWYREEANRLHIRRLPQLTMSRYADGPLLAGVWRQVVVLPRRVEADFDEREVRLMLAHELAHCKRRDLAWNWLPALVSWLFYFHPLVWLMTRRWCEAQEVACDEMLIQGHVARPADYGRLLVKLAQHLPLERRATLAAAGVLGTYRSLERRIQAMSRVKPISIGRLTSVAAALTLIVLPATVPWRLVAQPTSGPALASGQEPQGGASPASLPGKIYTRVSLEFKTEAGVTETYTGIIAIDPNTGTWEKIGELGHRFQMSPDGARYLYCTFRQPANDSKTHVSDVWMVDAKGGAPERIAEDAICPHWSPNGKEVLYFKGKKSEDTGWRGPTWLFDLATKQARKLPVPETDEVDDWSREGNWLVTVSDRHNPQGSGYQLYVMHPDGTGERRLTEGGLNCYPQFSPDGKRIVYKRSTSPVGSLWVVDVDGSNRKQVMIENADGSDAPDHASWSPDGKWLAVMVFDWQTEEGKKEKFRTAGGGHDRIVIIMPDGTNKRLLELEGVSKTIWVEDPQWY